LETRLGKMEAVLHFEDDTLGKESETAAETEITTTNEEDDLNNGINQDYSQNEEDLYE